MDKVDELVELVAEIIEDERYGYDYKDTAKQILSHPDLALIDREETLGHPVNTRSCDECAKARVRKFGYEKVIPLAERLKLNELEEAADQQVKDDKHYREAIEKVKE